MSARPGTARAALAHPAFRRLWLGALASNVGTWMQNVTLGAYAYELTGSPTVVGLLVFAQLGPMLFLSVVGGALADTFDRRRLLLVLQGVQVLACVALALVATRPSPAVATLFVAVLAVGLGNALNGPAWLSLLPDLVTPADLPGAVALNSTQLNASRVVGPAIGGLLYPAVGAAGVFGINALTYLFVVAALLSVHVPPVTRGTAGETGWQRILGGFRVAARNPLVRKILVLLTLFSFFCLPFIGQLPVLAAEQFGLWPRSLGYGLLYAAFGVGTVAGALSVGTLFAGRDQAQVFRAGLAGFTVLLAALALMRHPVAAGAVLVVLGAFYFAAITALSTVLQEHLDTAVRGRVMALWMMAFAGTVPLGNLVAGPAASRWGITAVLWVGVAAAVALTAAGDLRGPRTAAVGAPGSRRAPSGEGLAGEGPATGRG